MNVENNSFNDFFLNGVDITSNIRAKGEYKYFYIGENSSETDKSFLFFSTMWYSEKVTKDMEIICSCYNRINTAQLFYNKKTKKYNLFIYKNIIDNRNENLSLKLLRIIQITPQIKMDNNMNKNSKKNLTEKEYHNIKNGKICLASYDYILLNEYDSRIILIKINTGEFVTLFSASGIEKENTYNIFDSYDETFIINGEPKLRSYIFLSQKVQDRKTPTYRYCYFTVQGTVEKNIHLYPINLDLGNSEPFGLKIAKIIHRDKIDNEQKCFFIICFLSKTIIFQLITDYDNVTLHQMFQKYCKIGYDEKTDDIQMKRLKFWINKSIIKTEKIQFSQGMNVCLNLSNNKICALMYYFEMKGIISYLFNYTDSPQTISKKIFINQKELNLSNGLESIKRNDIKANIYLFRDYYQFKNKIFFGYSDKNLIIFEKKSINIYEQNYNYPIFTYEFFDETLSSLIIFEDIGYTFILTDTKLFKIIYNDRYKLFDNEILLTNNKIHYYKYNHIKKGNAQDNFMFPSFEYKPEDVWNAYCKNLNIEQIKFPEDNFWSDSMETEEEESIIKMVKSDYNYELNNYEQICTLCNVKCEKVCSHCGHRYYCCYEHFRYDYFNFHFFECQLIQFFQRRDIMKTKNLEIRYKILYNELIKVSGRILNFIFTRIFSKKDYPYYLHMIIILINIFENFGFSINLSDFYMMNMNLSPDKRKYRHERCIFYLESIFYFVQLNLLKCTFTLRGGLYNLTDCYIKTIKSDIAPKLTPKTNNRLISLKIDKIKSNIIYHNKYFSEFNSTLFFDLKKYNNQFLGENNSIDIAEEYIIYHLKSLSLLAKFKIKIQSTIEVHNLLIDMILMFGDHYSENYNFKNIVPFCYFSTSFYLVEVGKIAQTVKILRKMLGDNYEVHLKNRLYALTYYNLGLLEYSIGQFDVGIHNIEIAYKIFTQNDFSDKIKFQIIDTLGLAYLNQKNLYKAYILLQSSIQERKKMNKGKYLLKVNKLYVYLNYIVDLYEYNYISKARSLIENKYKKEDRRKLIKFTLGAEDKELVIGEQNLPQFVKVVEFIWKLDEQLLKQLNTDNPPKAITSVKEEVHHDKSFSVNADVSQVSSLIYKENANEKNVVEEYEEDIEVKVNLYDKFPRQQQQEFNELKTVFLKRDIILRDSLGFIEKFNINYNPTFADEFQKIIEKLKVNFLLKDIFYCFQNEKWRDELYNYNNYNILFGLSKYLKLEKIQNMMTIEKSKNLVNTKKEAKELEVNDDLYDSDSLDEESNQGDPQLNQQEDEKESSSEEKEEENKEDKINIKKNNLSENLPNMLENKNNKLKEKRKNMSFNEFKKAFKNAIKKQEKGSVTNELLEFMMDPDENYLYILYKNVYRNNPDKDFIFQNPMLILNYIFIDINKQDSSPIIGRNNKIIKSVISNVKEEDEEYSLDSKNKSKAMSQEKKKVKKKMKSISSNTMNSQSVEEKDKILSKEEESKTNSILTKNENEDKKEKEIINKRKDLKKGKKDDVKDKSSLLTLASEHQKEEFIIVSKESTFIYIPERFSLQKENILNKEKNNKKPISKKLSYQNYYKINFIKDSGMKQHSNSMKIKQKELTFIEQIDKLFNSSILNKEEEEENKKTFALIQIKNRNASASKSQNIDKSDILEKKMFKEENKNIKGGKKFLLASLKSRKLWEKDNKDNFNIYKKINNNKVIKQDRDKIKKNKKDRLINKVTNDVDKMIKKETERAYLKQAKIRQVKKRINNREDIDKAKENKTMKLIQKGFNNKNNYIGFNIYMDNFMKLNKKEEKKDNIKNKSLMINSYVNMNYQKIKAKRKQNEIKEEFRENINRNKLSSYEQEKEKIFKFNSKLMYQRMNEELQNNDSTYENDYFNANYNSKMNYKINKFDESSNNKNFIFENSNLIGNNNISNSNNYKKIINSNIEQSNERNVNNIQGNTTKLIKKYKLFPFLKKNSLLRSKDNSLLNSISNTNTQTSRKQKKKIEKKEGDSIINSYMNKYSLMNKQRK